MAVVKQMFEDVHDRIDAGIVNKNFLRNGNFLSTQYAQQDFNGGQTVTAGSWTKLEAVDGWYAYAGNDLTVRLINDSYASIDDRAFNDPYRVLKYESSNSYNTSNLAQVIAFPDLFYRRKVILSGYCRSTTAAKPQIKGAYNFDYDSATGIGGSVSGGGTFGTNVTPTSAWTKFEFSFTFEPGTYGQTPTMSSAGKDAYIRFGLSISQASGTGGEIELTGLKLEQGDVSTPNSETLEEEIEKCKKWYQLIGAKLGEGDITVATGRATSTTAYEVYIPIETVYNSFLGHVDLSVLGTLTIRGSGGTADCTSLTFSKPLTTSSKFAYPGMIKATGIAGSAIFTSGEFVNLETKSGDTFGAIEIDFEGPHF